VRTRRERNTAGADRNIASNHVAGLHKAASSDVAGLHNIASSDVAGSRRLAVVRNAYVASVNAALEDGRDSLAMELAAEYEAEYVRQAPRPDSAAA
jgi:hypothetical protein